MKFSTLVVSSLALAAGNVSAFAPAVASPSSKPTTTSLSAQKDGNRWGVAMASAAVAFTFATRAAFGAVGPDTLDVSLPMVIESTPSSSVTVAASSFDTMDFSMPTYGDAIGGTVKAKGEPPAFNPFGDFDFKKKDEMVIEQPKPVEKVEKEEFKMPSFSAPKVVEASKVEAPKVEPPVVEEEALIKLPSFSMPKIELPKVEIEETSKPAVEMPMVDMPKIEMPRRDIPKVDFPDMPKMEMPKMDIPKVDIPDMPKMEMPKMPKFDMPKMDMPKITTPSYDFDVDIPKVPKVDIPKVDLPKIDFPKVDLPNPFGGGSSNPADEVPLEPREVRDERARTTRTAFLAADQDVKDAEEALKVLKEVRSAKKQIANDAKDLACADRPGGKVLCLRNPFQAGF